MASASEQSLATAIEAVEKAFAQLDVAAEFAVYERAQSAVNRESAQAEITHSWQAHTAELESALANTQSENAFLKADNMRLANQLQVLQKEYLALQKTAGETVGRLDATVKQLDLILEH